MSIKKLLTALAVFFVIIPQTSFASEVAAEPALLTKVKEAKEILKPTKLNYTIVANYKTVTKTVKKKKVTQKVLDGYTLASKDLLLAILDPSTDKIITTKALLKGDKITFSDKKVDVSVLSFNGVNSRFQVNSPVGGKVVALKYLITPTETAKTKTAITKTFYDAYYTPYSPDLSSADLVQYGDQYVSGIINTVSGSLANIPSSAIPGKTVTQAIPANLVKSLIYAEHTSSSSILSGAGLDQLNVLFALNGPDTYKYSVSNDGFASRGLAQFLDTTYAALVKRHPDLGFIKDYKLAMEDHTNAIKAMYVLLDDYAGNVRERAGEAFLENSVFDYAAAAYNGGPARVAKAVASYRENWNLDRRDQIANAQTGIDAANAEISALQAQIKATSDENLKATIRATLATEQAYLAALQGDLNNLQAGSLRGETINYLNKIYNVRHVYSI